MPPKDSSICWLCGRSSAEVRESVGRPLQPDSEVERRAARVRDSKAAFVRESSEWWSRVPDQLKSMDFDFVMGNHDQFKAVSFVEEAERARANIADSMSEAARRARQGEGVTLGEVKISAGDKARRDAMVQAVEEFERKTGRLLSNGAAKNDSAPHGFEGLDMARGIAFLRDVGMLYYAVQERFIESEREEEMSKRPTFGVGVARIPSISGEVHVCTICQTLITGLPSA